MARRSGPGRRAWHVRVARSLGTLPQLAQALARGELSYSKVRALTRVATPETEERLLSVGRAGTAEHVERIVRAWRYVDRKAETRDAGERHATRTLYVFPDDDGMVVVRGRLEPEVGAVLMKALEAARETLYQRGRRDSVDVAAGTSTAGVREDMPTAGQMQADALALLAETALHRGMDPGAAGERYQVVVHVDAAVLADADAPGQSVLEGGPRVPAETSQRLACDADATRRRGPDRRGRRADADDSAGATPSASPPRSRLSLPRLRCALRPGPSHPPLGTWRAHHAVEPGLALPPPPSRSP